MASYEELAERYKRLRRVCTELNEHLSAAVPQLLIDQAGEKLGLMRDGALAPGSEDEKSILMDYAVHDCRQDGANAVDRYVADHPPRPGSDEATVLEALRQASFAILRVDQTVEGFGAHVTELLDERRLLLADIWLSRTAKPGLVIAARLMPLGDFVMTTGAQVPLGSGNSQVLKALLRMYDNLFRDEAAGSRSERQADLGGRIIQMALEAGASERIHHRQPDEEGDDWQEEQDEVDDEELANARMYDRACELVGRFVASPMAAELSEDQQEHVGFLVQSLLVNAWEYHGQTAEQLTAGTLKDILLDIFPRKLSMEAEGYEAVAPVVQAFLRWLGAEGILPPAEMLAEAVGEWHEEIVAAGADRRNWGPGKQFAMAAQAAGVDLSDQGAMHRFMLQYNLTQMAKVKQRQAAFEPRLEDPYVPVEPIVRQAPKVGRNDPCPCGSGKKHKKCCGR